MKNYVNFNIRFSILIGLLIIACAGFSKEKPLDIDYAYLRRVSEFDSGTVHLFMRNNGTTPVLITSVSLNDTILLVSDLSECLIEKPPDDVLAARRVLWYQVLPNPIPPGKVSDVMVKLSWPTRNPIKLGIETDRGEWLYRVIPPMEEPLRITFIGFSKGFDRVYVYLHNLGEEKVYVSRIFLDGEEVTRLCSIPSSEVLPGEKLCITINLEKPSSQGEYVVINVTTANYTVEGPIKAEAITRVFSHFPICFENGETDPSLYMNTESYFLPYPTGESKSFKVEKSGEKVYHISDCPMHAHENLIAAGRYILSRADVCRAFDARHPVHAGICRHDMLRGYAIFGETADVTLINPNVSFDYSTKTLARLAKEFFGPRPLQTMVLLSKNPPYFEYRYPTPEEVRLMVYYTVSAGSKGIFYRGRPPTEELKNVVRTLNGELQILKRFLKIGEPVSMAETDIQDVEANTILSGDRAVVLILINNDFQGYLTKGSASFTYTPKKTFKVTVNVPEGMEIRDVYEVGGEFKRIQYQKEGENVIISVDMLDLTRQFVLTTQPDDYNFDQDGDGFSDIQEIATFSTHPDNARGVMRPETSREQDFR